MKGSDCRDTFPVNYVLYNQCLGCLLDCGGHIICPCYIFLHKKYSGNPLLSDGKE
jgi:hypothetical protein